MALGWNQFSVGRKSPCLLLLVQSLSQVQLFVSDSMDCSMPGFPVFHYLPEFAQTHVLWIDDAIQPSHPLSSPSPPAFNLSQHQGLFQWVSSSYQVAKYWSFSFSISPSSEYSGLMSLRIDWFDLLAVQGTLSQESFPTPQFENINCVALSLLYGPTLTSVLGKPELWLYGLRPYTVSNEWLVLQINTTVWILQAACKGYWRRFWIGMWVMGQKQKKKERQ